MCAELLSGWFARGRPGSRCLSQLLTSPLIRLLMLLGGSADRILASGLPGGVGRSELLAAGNQYIQLEKDDSYNSAREHHNYNNNHYIISLYIVACYHTPSSLNKSASVEVYDFLADSF